VADFLAKLLIFYLCGV